MGPGVNPLWQHEVLPLEIGKPRLPPGVFSAAVTLLGAGLVAFLTVRIGLLTGILAAVVVGVFVYAEKAGLVKIGKARIFHFRTLSLLQVWRLWPNLAPIYSAILRSQPLDFHDRITGILEVIQPDLVSDTAALTALTPGNIDLLLNFYRRQDWARIKVLCEKERADEEIPTSSDAAEAHQQFVLICAAAARHANMAMNDFLDTRFEFAADTIMSLHAAAQKAAEEVEDGRSHSWRETTMKLAATFGVKPEPVPSEKQPEWMKVMERVRVN